MNFVKFCYIQLVFVTFSEQNLQPVTENIQISASSTAINQLIDKFFIKNKIRFDVFIFRESFAAEKFLIELKNQNSYYLTSINSSLKYSLNLFDPAVIFTNSCQDISLIHKKFKLKNYFGRNFKFLAYIDDCGVEYIRNNIEHLVKNQQLSFEKGSIEIFEHFLINDEKFLHLASIEWFTETSCNRPQLIILNSFNKFTQKWSKKLGNHKKFQNFHNCKLILGLEVEQTDNQCWGSLKSHDGTDTNFVILGISPAIFLALSKIYNFDPEFYPFFNNANHVDVFLPVYRFEHQYIGHFHVTSMFAQSRDIIISTPGVPYTPYEKLLLPFDSATWVMLNLTFSAAFVTILMVNKMPKFFQKRIFGEYVKTPALNVISTFFGISQTKLPAAHVPRVILMLFVFFCLIFRTCFQSKMFEFMTSEPRRPAPKSIADLKDRNYTMYTILTKEYVDRLIEDEKDEWPTIYELNSTHFFDIYDTQSRNASAKISLLLNIGSIKTTEIHLQKSLNWHKIPNYGLQVSHTGFIMEPNNFFFNILDKSIKRMIQAGIIDFMVESCSVFDPKTENRRKLSKLLLESLNFGFVIWLGSFVLCFGVFIVEVIAGKINNKKSDMIEERRNKNHKIKEQIKCTKEVQIDIDKFVNFVIQKIDVKKDFSY